MEEDHQSRPSVVKLMVLVVLVVSKVLTNDSPAVPGPQSGVNGNPGKSIPMLSKQLRKIRPSEDDHTYVLRQETAFPGLLSLGSGQCRKEKQ